MKYEIREDGIRTYQTNDAEEARKVLGLFKAANPKAEVILICNIED